MNHLLIPVAIGATQSKCAQLRQLLESPQLEFIMEAHNGISARIVEEAGFKGIWGSGLALSTQYGVRDNNEASWTQVVEMLEFMSDITQIPILLDGDTGYGNFNNMRRLVKKLEQRAIAGVCIEDKLFPKTNSFINGDRQPLADIDQFCGKIKAGKDSQTDPDFCVVARVEAFIAGWGLSEALRRAEAYRTAGADAILIHSKLSRPDQVLAFAKEWANRAPLAIVPTKYYSTPNDVFRKAGVSLVIWANHLIRAAVASMQAIAEEVHRSETLVNIEDDIRVGARFGKNPATSRCNLYPISISSIDWQLNCCLQRLGNLTQINDIISITFDAPSHVGTQSLNHFPAHGISLCY